MYERKKIKDTKENTWCPLLSCLVASSILATHRQEKYRSFEFVTISSPNHIAVSEVIFKIEFYAFVHGILFHIPLLLLSCKIVGRLTRFLFISSLRISLHKVYEYFYYTRIKVLACPLLDMSQYFLRCPRLTVGTVTG
jgi:hypothetical protein